MGTENIDLEEQCEDAVYDICCVRESYPARCAKHLDKYLELVRRKQTSKVQINPVPDFEKPTITERQEKLYDDFLDVNKTQTTNEKGDALKTITRIKELKSILGQIERSNKTEMQQLLKQ